MPDDETISVLHGRQKLVLSAILHRVSDMKPTILIAGENAGKTTICQMVSHFCEQIPQLVIGVDPNAFANFCVEPHEYIHPAELPLDSEEGSWNRIKESTVIFIDDLFNLPDAEELYIRLCAISPTVVAMATQDPYGIFNDWPTHKYLFHIIGPYSTFEMNDSYKHRGRAPSESKRDYNRRYTPCVSGEWTGWKKP